MYKPRKGKVNGNQDKFTKEMNTTVSLGAGKMLKNFGYYHMFNPSYKQEDGIPKWIQKFNQQNLQRSIQGYHELLAKQAGKGLEKPKVFVPPKSEDANVLPRPAPQEAEQPTDPDPYSQWKKIVAPKLDEVKLDALAKQFNELKVMKEDELIDGVLINHPRFLIRQKCKQYPRGRTGKRFFSQLKGNCTIIDKTKPGEKKDGVLPSPLSQQEIIEEESTPTLEERKE